MTEMPFLPSISPVDIISPASPISDTSTTTPFKEFLDGSTISTSIFEKVKSGIWWWCIIHNQITKANVDLVYTTPTIYFELETFIQGLADFAGDYLNDELPKVKLVDAKGIHKLIYLSNPKLPEPAFIANITSFVGMDNLNLDTVDLYNIPDPNAVYRICSFRRLLDPIGEYLEHKSQIDQVHIQDIKDDLLFSLKILDKNSQTGATLDERIKQLEAQIDMLLDIKERVSTQVANMPDTDRINIIQNITTKIAELEENRHKLLDIKERHDALR